MLRTMGTLLRWVKTAGLSFLERRWRGMRSRISTPPVMTRPDRAAEIVEVEAVEAGHLLVRPAAIMGPQPADEGIDVGVAPHPGREALEGRLLAVAPGAVADV